MHIYVGKSLARQNNHRIGHDNDDRNEEDDVNYPLYLLLVRKSSVSQSSKNVGHFGAMIVVPKGTNSRHTQTRRRIRAAEISASLTRKLINCVLCVCVCLCVGA